MRTSLFPIPTYVGITSYLPIHTLSAFNSSGYNIVVLAITLRAYYDGSGTAHDPNARFLTLAGYVGTPNAWRHLEERWCRVLQRWECAYLHMKDADSLQEEFAEEKGWTTARVKGLLQDLFNECLSPTGWEEFKGEFHGASCTVNLKDYARACADIPSLSSKKPEAICVDFVVTIALMALPETLDKPFGKDGRVELYFDKNESFMCKVDRIWRSKPSNKLQGPLRLVTSIDAADSRNFAGLQAADFLAWHTNRYYTHGLGLKGAFAAITRVFATPLFSDYYDYEHLMRRRPS